MKATITTSAAKPFFKYFASNFPATSLLKIIPEIAPRQNGTATIQSIFPDTELVATTVIDTKAITVRDVAITDCIVRIDILCKAGTITKPPPAPIKPDKNPAVAPVSINETEHRLVHTNLPVWLFKMHGSEFGGLESASKL